MSPALDDAATARSTDGADRVETLLAGMRRDEPLELVEPPAGLWDRIEASIQAEPNGRAAGAGDLVEYRIDAHDVVVGVGADWAAFADANEAPELAGGATGRCLWDCMSPGPLQDLWRAAVRAVRSTERAATVPFRCDGPTARRWYEMTLTPAPRGSVDFSSRLVFEMERPEVPELRRCGPGDPEPTVEVCCWCAEASGGDSWRPLEEVLSTSRALEGATSVVAHGFCPRCAAVAAAELLVDH